MVVALDAALYEPTVASCGKLPPRDFGRVAACAGYAPRPPVLRRQNASLFQWPPDTSSSWTYLALSPSEFAAQLLQVCGQEVSARDIASYFADFLPKRGREPCACAEYARAWALEIEEELSRPQVGARLADEQRHTASLTTRGS